MTLRFRRSIKLAPGVRWNVSGSGSSWSFGPRGASVSVGKRGTYFNGSLPGTGLSSRVSLSHPPTPSASRRRIEGTSFSLKCSVADDGQLIFTDSTGAPAPEGIIEVAKRQNRDALLGLIQQQCDLINEQVENLGRLHEGTPVPRKPKFVTARFPHDEPTPPVQRSLGFLDRLLPWRGKRLLAWNEAAASSFRVELAAWQAERAAFEQRATARRALIETAIYQDLAAMERFLEETLGEIIWPRETIVAFEILDAGTTIALDVDLPELEHMPSRQATVPTRGLKLSVKQLTATKVQQLYAKHVHGIVFRLVGEAFAALPTVNEVIAAGYTQRRDPTTASMTDDYLLSLRVRRDQWAAMDFEHLAELDVVEALGRFDLRRQLLKSGALKTIEPHSAGPGDLLMRAT